MDLSKYKKEGKKTGAPKAVYIRFAEKTPGYNVVRKLKAQGIDVEGLVYDKVLSQVQ